MKSYRRILAVILLLAIGLGLRWAVARYIAMPPATGEAYPLVSNWPRSAYGVTIGQVAGVGVDSHGDVFVFQRAERVWEGEELALEFIPPRLCLSWTLRRGIFLGHGEQICS
jgi:hypothetical protein